MSNIEGIQIHFNSKYSISFNNNLTSDCNFFLNNRLEIPNQHYLFVSVVHANIPYSFYNINSNNNFLSYTINSITYTLTITKGNYNALNLVNFINSNLQTGFTCSYNSITNKITFLHTTYEFQLNSISSILSVLGISSSNLISSNKTLTSDLCLNLQSCQTINILSNLNVGNLCLCELNTSNILCSIPVSQQPFSNIIYVNQNNFRNNLYSNVLNFIKLKLVDEHFRPIDLNGLHWSCSLEISIYDFNLD